MLTNLWNFSMCNYVIYVCMCVRVLMCEVIRTFFLSSSVTSDICQYSKPTASVKTANHCNVVKWKKINFCNAGRSKQKSWRCVTWRARGRGWIMPYTLRLRVSKRLSYHRLIFLWNITNNCLWTFKCLSHVVDRIYRLHMYWYVKIWDVRWIFKYIYYQCL